MTHTNTEQPEALRLVETWQAKAQKEASRQNSAYDVFGMGNTPESVDPLGASMAAELRRLYTRVQKLTDERYAIIAEKNEYKVALRAALLELEASQAQRLPLDVATIAEIAESFEATDPSDSFWVELCRAFERASVVGITQEKQP